MLGREPVERLLDVATGTADLAILGSTKAREVVGVDISEGMLKLGREKVQKRQLTDRVTLQRADSADLPFTDAHFDAVTVAFGVRNFEDLERGIAEMVRVLRPGTALRARVQQAFEGPDETVVPALLPPRDACRGEAGEPR